MSVTFTRTRNQLAAMVLRKLGYSDEETETSGDLTIVYEAIDLRLKELHRLGVFWPKVTKTPVSFSLGAGISTASASVDIAYPIAMTVIENSEDMPVSIIDVRQYAEIQDKTETGTPTKALWKGSAEFVFWPVPVADTTAKLTYERIADDTSASAGVDVQVSMLRWLKDIVAYDLGDDFNRSEQQMKRFEREAMIAERNIRKLAVQHVDYGPVYVDDFDGRRPTNTRQTDY